MLYNHLIKYKANYKSLILSQKLKKIQKSRNQKAGDCIFDFRIKKTNISY